MDNYLEQGRNITTALNELEKFFIEIIALQNLLINKLDTFLDSSTKYKASNYQVFSVLVQYKHCHIL